MVVMMMMAVAIIQFVVLLVPDINEKTYIAKQEKNILQVFESHSRFFIFIFSLTLT